MTDNQRQSDRDCELGVLEAKIPMLPEKLCTFEKLYSEVIEEDYKCLQEHPPPVIVLFEEETQLQPCASSAIEIPMTI